MKIQFKTFFATGLLLCTPAAFALSPADDTSAAARLKQIVEDHFDATLALDPLFATRIGEHKYDDQLGRPANLATRARRIVQDRVALQAAEALARDALAPEDQLSLDLFIRDLKLELQGERFPDYLMPMTQLDGLPMTLAVFGSGSGPQPLSTLAEHQAWLRRADGFPAWVDDAIAAMREGAARDVTLPRITASRILPQLDQILAAKTEDSVFWLPVRERMPAGLDSEALARLGDAYRTLIETRLQPAYRKLRAFIANEYLPHCRTNVGWDALPDGPAWYGYAIETSTTLNWAPDRIHTLGLAEVARIEGEMRRVMHKVGYKGSLKNFFHELQTSPRFYFKRPEELVEGYRQVKARVDAQLPRIFSMRPHADYEIRPVEDFRAEAAPGAFYEAASADGSRPGVFYINTFNLKAQPIYGMETLSLHEAAPGHHYQISLSQEMTAMPRFRRFASNVAFEEGWALYSESLGGELGLYSDPYQWYGHLSDEMLRAMRLVVDTGLHHKGWSRERAIAFMQAHSSMAQSDVIAEVERYMVWPGQALGYKLGQLTIRRLRSEAEQALGPRFDVREFHRQVLSEGALPLPLLETRIRRWIAVQKG